MEDRKFVLCVGAQKSGTTWLCGYVDQFKAANIGIMKEYHVWDSLYSDDCAEFRISKNDLFRLTHEGTIKYNMQNVEGFYEDYFSSIFDWGFKLTGDFTPSYAALDTSTFLEIRERIKSMNAVPRVVFLMRDPAKRCWSAVNYFGGSDVDKAKVLRSKYSSRGYQFRTRYERTVSCLREAFEEEQLYFGFYESLFQKRSIERLSHFLGVQPKFDFAKKRMNPTDPYKKMPKSLYDEVRNYYQSTYDFCGEHFPETKSFWKY